MLDILLSGEDEINTTEDDDALDTVFNTVTLDHQYSAKSVIDDIGKLNCEFKICRGNHQTLRITVTCIIIIIING